LHPPSARTARGARLWPAPCRLRLSAIRLAALGLLAACVAAGCAGPIRFPAAPLAEKETAGGLVRAYDTNGDKAADFFTFMGSDGRITRIGYDTTGDSAADSFVRLDEPTFADCRHVVLVLDGVPLHLVREFQSRGRLRLFYAPSRVVSTYPAMTDLALAEVFRSTKPLGYESLYYNHRAERLMGGNGDYLSLKNEAWARRVDYRAGTTLDPLAYLYPRWAFDRELEDFDKVLARRDSKTVVAYFVSTAGLATRDGAAGIEKVLDAVDRLALRLVAESRGLVKITVLSDHGHTLARCERIDFRRFLADKGWRVTDRLQGPKDVVPVEYGLITYASFAARDRPALAADLLQHRGVRFAIYPDGERVIVRTRNAEAHIENQDGRYRYEATGGDPLQLLPVLERLRAEGKMDSGGFVADRDLFLATADHVYPDAVDRLWRAFHTMAENVPDVVADLQAGFYAGAAARAAWFPTASSTHGDLERLSSTAFLMSTGGRLPEPLRSRDVPDAIERLTGGPWPVLPGGDGR